MKTKTAYLSLGANLGDKAGNMRAAIRLIKSDASCEVTAVSPLYETKPVGLTDQPDFANAVIEVQTTLSPHELLGLCNSVENELGRKRTIRWGPRVIDIDILLYSGVYISDDNLTVPHPRLMERAFVLVPLADIAPDVELPGHITAREAADGIDASGVSLIRDNTWSQ